MKFFCSNLGAMLCNHGFEFARGMGGWVGLRNGWMAGWVDGRRDGWVAGGMGGWPEGDVEPKVL
jgi:hypothetical protein